MTVNDPEIVRELEEVFAKYETALNENDIAVLDELFWDSQHTVRYGIGEQLYGYEAIAAFRAGRDPIDLRRELTKVVITAFGDAFAIASCEYRRLATGRTGRQMQTWIKTPQGWRVAAAHVSFPK